MPQIISTHEIVERYTEQTSYGDHPVVARRVDTVRRWDNGDLELCVAYWFNGQRRPGYSTGDKEAIAQALAVAQESERAAA